MMAIKTTFAAWGNSEKCGGSSSVPRVYDDADASFTPVLLYSGAVYADCCGAASAGVLLGA